MFSSSCCKRSLIIVIVLSCVWHLDSGTIQERNQEQNATPAVVATAETPSPLPADRPEIKDRFPGRE